MPLVRPTWCPIPPLQDPNIPRPPVSRCKVPCVLTYFSIVNTPSFLSFDVGGSFYYANDTLPFLPTPILDELGNVLCTAQIVPGFSPRIDSMAAYFTGPSVSRPDRGSGIAEVFEETGFNEPPFIYGPYSVQRYIGEGPITIIASGGPSPAVRLNEAQEMVPIATSLRYDKNQVIPIPAEVPILGQVYLGYFTLPSPPWPL